MTFRDEGVSKIFKLIAAGALVMWAIGFVCGCLVGLAL